MHTSARYIAEVEERGYGREGEEVVEGRQGEESDEEVEMKDRSDREKS